MDRYIKLKKKIYKLSEMIKMAALTNVVYSLHSKFQQQREFMRVQALKKFAYVRSALLYKMRLRKFGPSYIFDKYLSQIKGSLSLVTTSAMTQMDLKEGVLYNSVLKELSNFFQDYMWKLMSIKMLSKTKRLFELIHYMQVKIQRNRITIENQTQILLNYWNQLNLKLLRNAVEHQDDGMNHMLVQI